MHPSYFKPKKTEPTRTFEFDDKLKKQAKKKMGRCNEFVIVPGVPRIPTKHSGVPGGGGFHATLDMSHDHKEMIRLGESTIDMLLLQNKYVCPNLIYLSLGETKEVINNEGITQVEDEAYIPHLLKTYSKQIKDEKQLQLTLHVASHGNHEGLGSVNRVAANLAPIEKRMDMEDFAALLARILDEIVPKNQPIYIVFHSCNSAYCATAEPMTDKQVEQIVIHESLIGRFIKAMKEEGFKQVTATGFRGFYVPLEHHKGVVVQSDLVKADKTMPADSAKYTIFPDNSVKLPASAAGKFFAVNIPKDNNLGGPPSGSTNAPANRP